jgi:GNAT superfamily N-acetyltransferase
MTLSKKGTRIITVEGRDYRWLVVPDDEPGLAIVVELAEYPGERMETWVDHGNIISPWLVRKSILNALSQGWQPQTPGKSMAFGFGGLMSKENEIETLFIPRIYQDRDYRSVLNLHQLGIDREWGYGGKGKWDDRLQEEITYLYSVDRNAFIVGCLEDEIIAFSAFKYTADRVARIDRLQVHPDFQRCGYGQKMINYLETLAIKYGYQTLNVYVNSLQGAAERLYLRKQYKEIERHPWRTMERIYLEKQLR